MNLILKASIITTVFTTSFGALAQSEGVEKILIHSYGSEDPSSRAFSLSSGDALPSMESRVNSILDRLDKNIGIRSNSSNVFSLLQNNIRSNEYSFEVDGFSLCQFQVKAHETINGSVTVLGSVPNIPVTETYALSQWPDIDSVISVAQVQSSDFELRNDIQLKSKSACLWVHDNELQRVWKMVLSSGGLSYKIIADSSQIYDSQPNHFHADGTAQVYDTNPTTGELTTFNITGLTPDENGKVWVENSKFITLLDTNDYSYFVDDAAPYEFVTSASEEAFKEISLFTNANRALDWLESQGYTNFGDLPIKIVVHASFDGDTNNALYAPSDDPTNESPIIYVGDGDGSVLQNLALDYDVISHELGHHVIYHSIKNIRGESLVLHEGIADFLTYAKTNDACLGESICPSTSGICAVTSQCLRTADNDLALTSSDLPNEAHLRSQFISGYLWDLVTVDALGSDLVTGLVLQAINLWVEDSGYNHFVLGLMVADEANNSGANCDVIYNRAIVRGMSGEITDYDCNGMQSLVATNAGSLGSIFDDSVTTESTSDDSDSKSWCGSISFGTSNAPLSLALFLGLPFLLWSRKES